MAAPRPQYGEAGEGTAHPLVPPLVWVRDAKAGRMLVEVYRSQYLLLLSRRAIQPGRLWFAPADATLQPALVTDGDTLVCACSRAAAAEGRCHRCWAAAALVEAGWRVVLDGQEVQP
jgi:hypothetical protein